MNAELTAEQQFAIARFKLEVQNLTKEEAQQRLNELYEQVIYMEARYVQLLGKVWGLTGDF